jgi:hypothetical protein
VSRRIRRARGGREEGLVVGEAAEGGEVGVELAGVEAAEVDGVPEAAGEVAAEPIAVTVGGERDPTLGEGQEDGEAPPRSDAPEAEGAVERGRGEGAAVGAEGHAHDRIPMSVERGERVARGEPPQAHRSVVGARGEEAAVGAHGHDGLAPGDRYVGKNSFILKAELGKSEAGHEH